ncbi:MAG: class I SAM-dependent methyltransferase [Gaiellaceae bacterium MAG52_C11]|nr:class I SAM-dependent methyltransferase [Candidatus Gaiellasilicea maunaloa]
MTTAPATAPGIPADYYRQIFEVEERHWWYRGMRTISAALLGERLTRPGQRLFDAGCGTGGFLRWALDRGSFAASAGVDIGSAAIELARTRLPDADLRTAPLHALPFGDAAFELVVSNDVLQHVPEDEVDESLAELRRVLAPGGTLLLRTNGARRLRRERADWRAYDRATLVGALERAGFAVERATYVNALLSLYGAARGHSPRAPSESQDGIPRREPSRLVGAVGGGVLAAEARWLARPGRALPYGHTLFAVASPA